MPLTNFQLNKKSRPDLEEDILTKMLAEDPYRELLLGRLKWPIDWWLAIELGMVFPKLMVNPATEKALGISSVARGRANGFVSSFRIPA